MADALAARGVPFLFSTGYSDHDAGDGYSDWPILEKPYTDETLAKTLQNLLLVERLRSLESAFQVGG